LSLALRRKQLLVPSLFNRLIARHFRRPSGLLGRFTASIMEKGNRSNYERLLKELDPEPSQKILEIGYGPGVGIELLLSARPNSMIHGIDFSKLMYRHANKRNKDAIRLGKVRLFYGDFLTAPMSAGSFDVIFCINVLYFWNPLSVPFEKVRSLLAPNGCFLIYMAPKEFFIKRGAPDDIFNKYSIEQVEEALHKAGFQTVRSAYEKGYYIKAMK